MIDRLTAFYHWNDRQSLAVAVAIAVQNRVNLAAIRRWSLTGGAERGFDEFVTELTRVRRRRRGPTSRRRG